MIKCANCNNNKGIVKRRRTGDILCKSCFCLQFEEEIHQTIVEGNIFQYGDKVALGASGGKDSTVLISVLKKLNEKYNYGIELYLLSIDEGIAGYRDDSLKTVEVNKQEYDLPLKILSYKQLYGTTMDDVVNKIGQKHNCSYCGVFRRQALEKGSILIGANKIGTGHNADDVAETVLMNVLRGDIYRLEKCILPISKKSAGTIVRCKPLLYSYEKEIVLYAFYNKLTYFATECKYSKFAYRGNVRSYIKKIEEINPKFILNLINSVKAFSFDQTKRPPQILGKCQLCGNISSKSICQACWVGLRTHLSFILMVMAKSMNDEEIIDVPQEYVLFEPPSDGISCLKFSPASNDHLLVSSWDSTVRLYNVNTNQLTLSSYTTVPVLSCCFADGYHFYTAGLDGIVKTYEISTMKATTLGCHEKAVRCISPCFELNAIISGSWDKTCKFWDGRLSQAPITMQQQGKVYAMSVYQTKLMVITSTKKIFIWDLRYPSVPTTKKDCASKYQVRHMETFPNGDGFAYGTIEGRIYVETFNDESLIDRYSFKCHRVTNRNGLEYIYPVNSIAFHPEYNTFATGGSDGIVNLWDPYNKKRLCHLRRYPNPVVSLSYSLDGSNLAIASSYQFEENMKDFVPPDTIYIRKIKNTECMQRPT